MSPTSSFKLRSVGQEHSRARFKTTTAVHHPISTTTGTDHELIYTLLYAAR